VALTGDGSAMYTCQALWTAARDQVGVVFVILNNRSYASSSSGYTPGVATPPRTISTSGWS
jgi:thiamine pyrophosphate-dependent acetolactate synthase large subunit-like protein